MTPRNRWAISFCVPVAYGQTHLNIFATSWRCKHCLTRRVNSSSLNDSVSRFAEQKLLWPRFLVPVAHTELEVRTVKALIQSICSQRTYLRIVRPTRCFSSKNYCKRSLECGLGWYGSYRKCSCGHDNKCRQSRRSILTLFALSHCGCHSGSPTIIERSIADFSMITRQAKIKVTSSEVKRKSLPSINEMTGSPSQTWVRHN